MKWPFQRRPHEDSTEGPTAPRPSSAVVGVVVPAYGTEALLGACLDSLLAQTHPHWRAVVVDDGSPDRCGEIAEAYAARDPRITVLHTDNGGLGAARNLGTRRVGGDYVTWLDSDDTLPPTALATQLACLEASGSDFVVGSLVKVEAEPPLGGGTYTPRWMKRLHREQRTGIRIADHPEMLGDVFAVNKLVRESFWERHDLSWPERIRYEDQPTTTRAYLAGTFDVIDDVVYEWRIRTDGTSITQQRSSLEDLRDRWTTKKMALTSVLGHGDDAVSDLFSRRVLPGDLWVYFHSIPGCSDEWWDCLRHGIDELWGPDGLTGVDLGGDSILTPAMRLCAWLVAQDRRDDATALIDYVVSLDGSPVPRTADGRALDVPERVLARESVPDHVLALRHA